jgi:3-hydroxyisobutyrate dehydrogenase-like beta-hydroxyacid dehydrogenase
MKRSVLPQNPKVGFIGFGEVSYHFSRGLKEAGIREIFACDKHAGDSQRGKILKHRAKEAQVWMVPGIKDLVARSDLVISAVWGNEALKVAREAASFVDGTKVFCDVNNTPPSVKHKGAELLGRRGAGFLDAALFSSPAQDRHKAFILVSGQGAEEFRRVMSRYGMKIRVVPGEAGRATTLKTLANMYYKGIQATCLELAVAALKAGVHIEDLAPLVVKPVQSLPKAQELGYWITRGALHAERKAAELESIVRTVREWGVKPIMLEATRRRLRKVSELHLTARFKADGKSDDYVALVRAMAQVSSHRLD